MSKISWLGLAIAGLIGTAAINEVRAADFTAPPVLKAPIRYDWNGFYVGVNAGGSAGRFSNDVGFTPTSFFVGPGSGSVSQYMVGALGGAQAGLNWQTNALVVGLETDIQATSQKGDAVLPLVVQVFGVCIAPCTPPPPTPTMGTVNFTEKLPWFGTVRARAGYTPADRWLVYVTGGLAYGEVHTDAAVTVAGFASPTFSFSSTRAGWTLGGGIETALGGGWTGKVEYLHVDLGSVGGTFVSTLTEPLRGTFVATSHVTDEIGRVGVNYRFGAR